VISAWGDESGSIPDLDPDPYLVAAALFEDQDVPVVRKTMEALILPTETKVHWHGSSSLRRHHLSDTVSALPLAGVVVVHAQAGATDRRHRRKCLEYLLPNLASLPCGTVTFESRGPLDASDVDIAQKFRKRRVITSHLQVQHAIGRNEPALWVADIVCGAVVQARIGNPDYLDKLGGSIEVTSI